MIAPTESTLIITAIVITIPISPSIPASPLYFAFIVNKAIDDVKENAIRMQHEIERRMWERAGGVWEDGFCYFWQKYCLRYENGFKDDVGCYC
jgi:hypothetical protein